MTKGYYIKTFGCQMNEHDSQKIGHLLSGLGYALAPDASAASLILFNTCTVREKAHQKAYSEIGKAVFEKKSRPELKIAVCGCVAQEMGSRLLHRFPQIDLIFGPDQIYQLPRLLALREEKGEPVVATDLINDPEHYHFLDSVPATRLKSSSAFVTIMKGCNSQCSYCIVPQVRGAEVCRDPQEIAREVETLASKGFREVTLLGQNVNSYQMAGTTFAQLLRRIADATGIERIRFMSPHPKDVKQDLVDAYADNPKLCAHIHLPLQSGSDAVLRRMRRAYNRRQYLEKVAALRKARPDIAMTTDIIVGFPGETEGHFLETLSLMEEVRFDNVYAFKYSVRPDTEAAGFGDDVTLAEKEARLQRLFRLQTLISKEKNQKLVGTRHKVLVEGTDRLNRGLMMGYTECRRIVNFAGDEGLIGAIVEVQITQAFANSLSGEKCGGSYVG